MTTRCAAGRERGGQRRVVADSARQLHRGVQLPDGGGEQGGVGTTAERGVKIYQVDPPRAGPLPGHRRRHRIPVTRLGACRPLYQPDRLTVSDVHGRKQGQGLRLPAAASAGGHRTSSSQFDSSAAPASPDFSGWNWVAHSGPFSTTAMKGSPCVAQVTNGAFIRPSGGNGSAFAA